MPVTEPSAPPSLDEGILEQMLRDLDFDVVLHLVETFVAELLERSALLRDAAARGELTDLQHEAHALKSSAATYGAAEVAQLGEAIDPPCRDGRRDDALAGAEALGPATKRAAAAFADWQRRYA